METKNTYEYQDVEKKWQAEWAKRKSFASTDDDPRVKYFCLEMFPYPSGNLHMGHVRNYTLGDAVARYHRMKEENVLDPIGWDPFGRPTKKGGLTHNM